MSFVGAVLFSKWLVVTNIMAVHISVNELGILVKTSAKKKSLNLTLPNGEIRISHNVIAKEYLPILYPQGIQG